MPQMSPMFWSILMSLFFLTLMSTTVKMYFFSGISPQSKISSLSQSKNLFWQW